MARKAAEAAGATSSPRWFRRVGEPGVPPDEAQYEYAGGYWEAREARSWAGCRDIFAPLDGAAADARPSAALFE